MAILTKVEYAELKCKTNHSFLRGGSHPADLVEYAHAQGLKALALTDLNGVYGMPKAYRASKQCPGLKLIVGTELTLEKNADLTLLAQDRRAYGLLCRLITAAHAEKPKGEASLEWDTLSKHLELAGHESLIAIAAQPKSVSDSLTGSASHFSHPFDARLLESVRPKT